MRNVASCFVAAVLMSLIGAAEAPGVPPKGPPITFTDGAPSVESLMDQFLDALARQDEAALTRLRVSKEEYTRIIMPGQIGGGFSSSPSNTPPPFNQGAFPPVSIGDDVRAQHRLVTEQFGIEALQLVVGWSMGGMQTYSGPSATPTW